MFNRGPRMTRFTYLPLMIMHYSSVIVINMCGVVDGEGEGEDSPYRRGGGGGHHGSCGPVVWECILK